MFDPQLFAAVLAAWAFGGVVGFLGATRHAYLWLSHFARRVELPEGTPALTADPPPRPRHVPPDPFVPTGRAAARGICLMCRQRWGTCTHTRNA